MKIILSTIIILVSLNLSAQSTYKAVSDIEPLKHKIETASASLKTLEADFIQDKNLIIMDELIRSKGHFVYQSPNAVRWEYLEPYSYLIIIKDGKITIKDDKKTNEMSMASNPIFEQINALMLSTVKGDILLNPDFDSKVFEDARTYKLELLPKDVNMKEFISKIELFLNKKDMSVNAIRIEEPMGDFTHISFTKKQINVAIPKNSFTLP